MSIFRLTVHDITFGLTVHNITFGLTVRIIICSDTVNLQTYMLELQSS